MNLFVDILSSLLTKLPSKASTNLGAIHPQPSEPSTASFGRTILIMQVGTAILRSAHHMVPPHQIAINDDRQAITLLNGLDRIETFFPPLIRWPT